ncbi:MAG: Uma2 family endonuclease [Lachnospiraceae bacterium]|nr:Uma2 family endonuclease [Lachnospiraceae bacterium]
MDAAKVLEESYTIEDIYNLPQGKRAELIDGEIYMMASPSTIHQRLVMALSNRIYNYIDSKQGSCEVFLSPFAVFLNADNEIYLEPDISVICDKSKITDEGCKGAPDWVIEIVSQSSKRMDYYIKLFRYRTAGVKEYWVVDPEKNHVIVYDFEHDEVMDYTFSDKVKAGIYEDLEIDFSEIQME